MRLFLHGFLGSKEDWEPLLSYYNKPAVAIDLPLSERDIPAAVHKRFPKAKLLVGYSAGGRIALEMHARFPGAYGQTVALSAHPGITSQSERRAQRGREAMWIEKLLNTPFNTFLAQWYSQPLFAPFCESAQFETTLKRRLKCNPDAWAHFLKTHGTSARKTHPLPPNTAFVFGSKDLKYASLYRTLSPFEIADAGHVVHLEQPALCASILETIEHGDR